VNPISPKKGSRLRAIHTYIHLEDYEFLKEYCIVNGQRGDFSHLIKTAVGNVVRELKEIKNKTEKEKERR
jgi:hypothetical protein|tara:strand:+ start:2835 stop:3044 length:210 start_codon:yes stop_codon:yes gene_type:complete